MLRVAKDYREGGELLDVACSSGETCIQFARNDWHCFGYDLVPTAVELSRMRVAKAGVAGLVTLHAGYCPAMAHPPGRADLVVDSGLFQVHDGAELPEYCRWVSEMLKPGGCFVVYTQTVSGKRFDDAPGLSAAVVRAHLQWLSFVDSEQAQPGDAVQGVWYRFRKEH